MMTTASEAIRMSPLLSLQCPAPPHTMVKPPPHTMPRSFPKRWSPQLPTRCVRTGAGGEGQRQG
eukprot:15481310-Alexandrium_andersonii.AAC.1